MISTGVTGEASRFSMLPRSRSRVRAMLVSMQVMRARMTPMSPGTMLRRVRPSGLYILWAVMEKDWDTGAREESGPFMSRFSTDSTMPCTAPMAPVVAVGSVASASMSIAGFSPRRRRRVKSVGILMTKETSPLLRAFSASFSLMTPVILK